MSPITVVGAIADLVATVPPLCGRRTADGANEKAGHSGRDDGKPKSGASLPASGQAEGGPYVKRQRRPPQIAAATWTGKSEEGTNYRAPTGGLARLGDVATVMPVGMAGPGKTLGMGGRITGQRLVY